MFMVTTETRHGHNLQPRPKFTANSLLQLPRERKMARKLFVDSAVQANSLDSLPIPCSFGKIFGFWAENAEFSASGRKIPCEIPCRRELSRYSLRSRIDHKSPSAQEAHQCHPQFPCHLHRQAGRC